MANSVEIAPNPAAVAVRNRRRFNIREGELGWFNILRVREVLAI
jgi:hypothetical protein